MHKNTLVSKLKELPIIFKSSKEQLEFIEYLKEKNFTIPSSLPSTTKYLKIKDRKRVVTGSVLTLIHGKGEYIMYKDLKEMLQSGDEENGEAE